MVRALLAGTKTQTRRAVRKQFAADAIVAEVPATTPEGWQVSGHSGLWWDDAGACIDDAVRCPYGMPGDQLFVRETWARDDEDGAIFYRADVGSGNGADDWERNRLDGVARYRWRPSIHMPRWASRCTLDVVGVRIERLQDISEEDAIAEGVTNSLHLPGGRFANENYAHLWDTINGEAAWDANPWVWVVAFKVGKN
jgi:hypothetical protein